ncbi:MAG: dihydrodipicolinate synthase family protein [Candidatus Latescibacteria bacterium]|nr:dihydrodipicolinate synthase family protein [Candidatus Latescibacterota bacterium]
MSDAIKGVLPVIHMPYLDDLSIDYATVERQVDWLFAAGADGLCLALVSDLLRLRPEERLKLSASLVQFARGRGPVVISVGAESTDQAVDYARAAQAAGAAAAMAIPPLSQGLSEDMLRAYFETILEAVEMPLIIQDASSYVGKSMSLDFQADLFQRHGERIMFKPEAAPLGPCISGLRERTAGRAAIFEGSSGHLLVDSHRRGIAGTIPGVELLDGVVALWRALEAGDEERAYQLYFPICAIATLQLQGGLDGFIVIERYLMHRRGLFPGLVHRGPLAFELDVETQAEIDRLFDRLSAIVGEQG